jgi:probable selenate reductase FAD-binding subunit
MTSLEYLRPSTMEEALDLLQKGIPLAGGTELTPKRSNLGAVIDLSELGLDLITISDEVDIGATVKLQAILDEVNLPKVLRDVCKLEAGWNLRNMATLGGTIKSSDGRSPLLTVLLALNVAVHYEPNSEQMPLDDFLDIREQPQIIRKIVLNTPENLLYEQVARAPRDFPQVCAAVATFEQSIFEGGVRVSLGGFGNRPILLGDVNEHIDNSAQLAQKKFAGAEDAWASAEYRSHVAGVLVKRLLSEIQ